MDDLKLVREVRSNIPDVDDAGMAAARQQLMGAIANEQAMSRTRKSRNASRRFKRAAGMGAVAATLTALVAVLLIGPAPQLQPHAAAVEALTSAAERAAEVPPLSGDGKYIYSKSRSTSLVAAYDLDVSEDPYFVLSRTTREIWKADDGSGLIVTVGEPLEFPTEEDEQAWIAHGRPPLGSGSSRDSFGPGELSKVDLENLPRDVDKLYDRLSQQAQDAGTSHDWAMLKSVAELLRETAAPADLREALYRVAARIPSIELVGDKSDSLGRQGTAVAVESVEAGVRKRLELIFQEETSDLLAEREVLLERDPELGNDDPPTTVAETTFLASGRAESLPT